ncbi:MAG: hypothetical protein GX047_01555 [Firmicutes bacterium]|nr:hypothetical protein [Bacillota bacterium]
MSGTTFDLPLLSLIRLALACFLTGTAVKLMDDYLDAPFDQMIGKRTWAAELKEAAFPYALAALSLGVAADPVWSITLFWASYAVGMRGDLIRPLSLGLTGWQEALVLAFLAHLLFGWQEMLSSWMAIFALQAIDDLRDQREDGLTGAGNWAVKWGTVETAIAAVLAVAVSAYLNLGKLVLVLLSSLLVVIIQESGAGTGGQTGD